MEVTSPLSRHGSCQRIPWKEKSFSLPLYPHYILFLGHCQPIKQSFQQVDERYGVGWGVGGKRRQSRTRAENQEPLLLAQHKPTLKSLYAVVTMTHLEKSGHSNEGNNTRKDLGIPHYPDMKAYLTSLTSGYLF